MSADPNAQPFAKGDLIRTEDPDFEMIYQSLTTGTVSPDVPPGIGVCSILDGASNKARLAIGTTPITVKINVRTNFLDRETGNVGMLQRGYIIQESSGNLTPDDKVKPDAIGDPVVADPATDLGEIYGIVIGKANTNDQTLRVGTADTELVIIKVGDY